MTYNGRAAVIASGGLTGGLSSVIAGGNFTDGLRQGLITAGLNHAMHEIAGGLFDDPGDPKGKKPNLKYKPKYGNAFGKSTPGINVLETSFMAKDEGITLPPFGIVVDSETSLDVIQHEYGHYLQYKELGLIDFYKNIGLPSIYNGLENSLHIPKSVPHRYYRTETDANYRAQKFYNSSQPIHHRPTAPINSTHNWLDRLNLYFKGL